MVKEASETCSSTPCRGNTSGVVADSAAPDLTSASVGTAVKGTCGISEDLSGGMGPWSDLNWLENILTRHKRQATWWLAGTVFVGLNVLLRFSIHQPPVWDGAMSVYPAAIELSRTDFDFARLFALPTYAEGGPNTHASSPWTIMVAALISLTGSLGNALPILHVISFGLAALTVAATYRLIAHSAPGLIAVLGALAVLLFPPMIAQTADVYLDLPLTCLGTWGLVMLLERRFIAASVLITLAVWIKPLAVIYAAVLLGFLLIYGEQRRRVSRAIVLAIPPLVAAALVSVVNASEGSRLPALDRYAAAIRASGDFLATMPDVLIMGGVALALIVISIKEQTSLEIFRIMSLTLVAVLAFVLLNPFVSQGIPFLPRYYIAVAPAVVAGILTFLSVKWRPAGLVAVSVLLLAFAININGRFYSFTDHPYYALSERSLAYRDLLALQLEDVALLSELSREMPVYYDYFGFYRLEYSELGYSDGPLESGISVFHHRKLAEAPLAELPDRFAFIFEYPVLGGEVLLRIWDEAKAAGAYVVETALTRGPYTVYVIEVNQGGAGP